MTNPFQYDLIDLRLFVSVAECRNLTRGAERVHLAPSSASHRIRLMEHAIGAPLLIRQARGVELTRAGEALLRHARQVFAKLEQMHADLAPYAQGIRGHVSIWANTHATHSFLPVDLAAFLKQHPQVSVTLEEHSSPDIVLAVAKGEVEVGVAAEHVDGVDVDWVPYRADRLVLIAPPEHPLATHTEVEFAQVLKHPFVMLHAGSAIHTFTVNAALALGAHLDVRIQVRSFEAVCRMVGAGVGIGLVPSSVVPASAQYAKPVVIGLREPWAQRDLNICVRKGTVLSAFAQALVDSLSGSARVG